MKTKPDKPTPPKRRHICFVIEGNAKDGSIVQGNLELEIDGPITLDTLHEAKRIYSRAIERNRGVPLQPEDCTVRNVIILEA